MNLPEVKSHDITSASAIIGRDADPLAVKIRMAVRALHGMIEQQSAQGMGSVEVYKLEYEAAEKIIDEVLVGKAEYL